jgi:hypothetical protein
VPLRARSNTRSPTEAHPLNPPISTISPDSPETRAMSWTEAISCNRWRHAPTRSCTVVHLIGMRSPQLLLAGYILSLWIVV